MDENVSNATVETPNQPVYNSFEEDQLYDDNPFFRKKILSIAIGLIVVFVIVFLSFFVIIPKFSQQKNENVTLTYWGLWEDSSVFSGLISEFERQHPNIKINYEKQDIKTLGKYRDRLVTRANNNTGPDIFRFHNSWVLQLKDLLLPLPQDLISSSELNTKYYNVVKKDLNVNGAYYGIPLEVDTLSLFVNKDIFKAAGINEYPLTWDDLVKDSRSLTVKDETGKIKTSGVALGGFDNISHSSDILSLLLTQNGADLKNLAGPTKKNAVDALDFYTSFAMGDSKVWDDSLDNSTLLFAKGNLAMYFGYSWDVLEIKALNPNLQFAVLSVPKLSDRKNTIASYWVEGVSVKSKHPKEAFEFLQFLTKKDSLSRLYTEESKMRQFGEPYPRVDMASLLKDNEYVYPFVSQANDASSTIFSSDTYDDALSSALNAYLGNAVRSVIGGVSSETAIETLAQGVNQLLGKYGK